MVVCVEEKRRGSRWQEGRRASHLTTTTMACLTPRSALDTHSQNRRDQTENTTESPATQVSTPIIYDHHIECHCQLHTMSLSRDRDAHTDRNACGGGRMEGGRSELAVPLPNKQEGCEVEREFSEG